MLRRSVFLSTVIVCLILNPLAAHADFNAQRDANEAVRNLRQPDEVVLANAGQEYANAYLAAYEQALRRYQEAFCAGIEDAKRQRYQQPGDDLGRDAYDRGYQQAGGNQILAQPSSQPGSPVKNHDQGATKISPAPIQEPSADQEAFIKHLAPLAQQIGREFDLYPSVIIAQAALESDWGRSVLGSAPYYNLFGVKGYFTNQTTTQQTTEYDADGHQLQIFSNFRRYATEYAALKDYAQVLEAPLYQGVHRRLAKDYRAATRALVGRYATDPVYDQKLNQLIESYQLMRYDEEQQVENSPKLQTNSHKTVASSSPPQPAKHFDVQPQAQHSVPAYLPVVGGAGTAGAVGLIRRHFFLK